MKSLNRVFLMGYAGKDPEVRYTKGGTAVAEFSIATSEKWKDKQTGQDKERTDWHTINAWGKLGELVGEYVKKGMPVHIEGAIRHESWEKDGKTHYRTKIQAQNITFLGEGSKTTTKPAKAAEPEPEQDFGDDIPFSILLPFGLTCAYAAENVFQMFSGLVA